LADIYKRLNTKWCDHAFNARDDNNSNCKRNDS